MPWLDKADGTGRQWVPDDQLKSAVDSELYIVPDDLQITLRNDRTGIASQTELTNADRFLEGEERAETGAERFGREEQARIERKTSGFGQGAATVVENAVDTATLGGYGLATDAILGDDYTQDRRDRNQGRANLALTGKAAGFVIPALLTGGSSTAASLARATPIGLAERAGAAFVKSGAGKGLGGQVAARTAGYGLEGGLVNVGEGVSELALSEDPLTTERIVGSLSSKFFAGAAVGGVAGGAFTLAGKAAEAGLGRAKGMLDDVTAKMQRGADVSADIGTEVVEDIRKFSDSGGDIFRVADGVASDSKAIIAKGRGVRAGGIKNLLEDSRGLAKNSFKLDQVGTVLRKEEDTIRAALADQTSTLAKLQKIDDDVAASIRTKLDDLARGDVEEIVLKDADAALYGQLYDIPVKAKKGISLDKGDLEDFKALLDSGAAKQMRSDAISRLPGALDENVALQARIEAARDALKPGAAPKAGLLEQTAQGSIFGAVTGTVASLGGPFAVAAPLIGAKVASKITDVVFRRMTKASADASIRSAKALESFMAAGTKAARIAPPLASKTLASVAFGPEPSKIANALAAKPSQGLSGAYLAREKELRSVTQRGPDGSLQMRPGARQALADRLAPVRAVAPLVADQMETIGARRVSFLASKLPKRPDLPVMQMGPDQWRPSEMAIRQFARYVAAVEDPGSVEERLADGSVTPEDAEAIRTVYPEMYEDIKMRILNELPQLQAQLPYERRLALSIFSGVPVDPAMHPRILRVLQASFANEPGSEGGTQAPKAQPRFGAMTKPDATPAQERAG